jgi:hypothetical protein
MTATTASNNKSDKNPETECVKFPTSVLDKIRENKKKTGVSIIHFLTEAANEKLNREKKQTKRKK